MNINKETLLWQIIYWALKRLPFTLPQVHFNYSIAIQQKPKKPKTMDITINNEQQVVVELHPVTPGGHPAPLDGAPTWTKISGDSEITVSEDGMSATLVSSDNPGDSEFLVKADADLGSGVVEVSDMIRLSVAGAQAASLGLVAGEPTPKP